MTNEHGLQTLGRTAICALVDGGKSQSAIARELTESGATASQSAVSAWCRGSSRPEPPLRKVIEAFYGIGEDDWLTDEEREFVRRSIARRAEQPVSESVLDTSPEFVDARPSVTP